MGIPNYVYLQRGSVQSRQEMLNWEGNGTEYLSHVCEGKKGTYTRCSATENVTTNTDIFRHFTTPAEKAGQSLRSSVVDSGQGTG